MERLRRLARLWNWLPAFRAVAETEHLPSASEELFLTAPALSRSIRLLEQDIGRPLFRRAGRRIELNAAGTIMLAAVRDAMRTIHEGLLQVCSEQLQGRVFVGSAGVITTAHVVPALEKLRRQHAELVPIVETTSPLEAPPKLLRGNLDVFFHSSQITHPDLETIHLGTEPSSIYCGVGHPLYRRRKVTTAELQEHEFVAPTPDEHGQLPNEGWPVGVPRNIGMHVDQMRVGCEVCAGGELLAVLPDVVASSFGNARSLHRLPIDLIPPTNLYATHRPSVLSESRAGAVVRAVRQRVERN